MLFPLVFLLGWYNPTALSCGTPPLEPSECKGNLQVGFSNIGGMYRMHPELNLFSENGSRMQELGLNTLHVYALEKKYANGSNAGQQWGPIASPLDFVKTPFVDKVFSRPDLNLITMGVWAYSGVGKPIDNPVPRDGAENQTINQLETEQFAALTEYLRTHFRGTGKTFVLKGWESDWLLLSTVRAEGQPFECLPSAEVAQARRMIEWMRAKQAGVTQGRAKTPGSDVKVYFAVEVNRVFEALGNQPCPGGGSSGAPRLRMAHLLPFIGSDMITYSAWDTVMLKADQNQVHHALGAAVDFLLDDGRQFQGVQPLWSGSLPTRMPPDPQNLGNARLLLSEVGVPENDGIEINNVEWRLKIAMLMARDKGLKAAYFWNLYDNTCEGAQDAPNLATCDGHWLYKPDGSESRSLKVFREIVSWCKASSQGKRDIVFVFDLTGSMNDDIASVKQASVDIVNTVAASSSDYRVAVVGYKDYPPEGDYPYQPVLGFTSDKASIISAIQSLSVDGGGDTPESTYTALVNTLRAQGLGAWREGATKSLILITDAPPHDPEVQTGYTATTVTSSAFAPYVERMPLAKAASSLQSVVGPVPADAISPSVRIFPIVVGDDPVTLASSTYLAQETRGQVFQAATAQDVVDAILDAVTTPPDATFSVRGAVGIFGSDMLGANRLTRGPCPGTPFMTASALNSTIDVSYDGNKASWDCGAPEYSLGTALPFTPGTKTFTFDPPGPYQCQWYSIYGTHDSESFSSNADGSCSVTVGMSVPSELFVWFYVRPIPLYKVSGAVGIQGSNMLDANRLTLGPCPDKPFITAAALGSTINVTQSDLGAARWDCAAPSFFFGDTLGQYVPLGTGTRNFSFTPPAGYRCVWYAAYGTKISESFSTNGDACSITLGLSADPGDVFLWYFVQKK
ncbi:VWA domain-containing protein [Archangium violaceum]|uniref:vWA domain-containing protein n=1 Tax=Archangium violaceum TaxID=83451 RepID=UPI0037BF105C